MSDGGDSRQGGTGDTAESARAEPLPWSIKLMGIAFLLYLLMRTVQGIAWFVRWVTGG